jgi:hypothetical protein
MSRGDDNAIDRRDFCIMGGSLSAGLASAVLPTPSGLSGVLGSQENVTWIETGASRASRRDALSSPGIVIFDRGVHAIEDTLEIESDDLTVIITDGTTLRAKPNPEARVFTSRKGAQYRMMFHAEDQSNIQIATEGTLDFNNHRTSTDSNGFLLDRVEDTTLVSATAEVRNANVVMALTDCKRVRTQGWTAEDVTSNGSIINPEGCEDCSFVVSYCRGGQEVIDLNGRNRDCKIIDVVGEDVEEVVDVNESPGTVIVGLRGRGECQELLNISGSSGHRRTARPPIGHSDGVTAHGVKGTAIDRGVKTSGRVRNLRLSDIDITSRNKPALRLGWRNEDPGSDPLGGFHIQGQVRSNGGGPTIRIGRKGYPTTREWLDLALPGEKPLAVLEDVESLDGRIRSAGGELEHRTSEKINQPDWRIRQEKLQG